MYGERGGSGMEFKYRAVDEQAARPPPLPPSSYSYFTEQAIRAGYLAPVVERRHGNFQSPALIREAIQRELEKERIREEIIAREIAQRRVLEAEVRREMMLDRELAWRGRGDGFDSYSFLPGAEMRFEPRDLCFGQLEGWLLEERIAMSLEKRLGKAARHEIGGHETVPFQERSMELKIRGHEIIPFQQRAVQPKIAEVTPTSEVSKEKEKIVFLVKPKTHLSGAKRKSVTPPEEGIDELPLIGVTKKKVKEEWSCAICQVSATSERGLNEHIQGKRHKSKEAALRAKRNGKNCGIGIGPRKAAKPTKLEETTNNSSSEQGRISKVQPSQSSRTGKSSLQIIPIKRTPEENEPSQSSRTGKSSLQIIPIKRTPEENEVPVVEVMKKADISVTDTQKKLATKKKKFKFWCEMCCVGAYSETVMEAHRKGKKHTMGLQEAMKNVTSPAPEMGGTEINDAEEPTKDTGYKTSLKIKRRRCYG